MPEQRLSARERDVLAFEREWLVAPGHKQAAIRERFGFSPSYYYQLLGQIIWRAPAEEHDPLLVRRLRRRTTQRRVQRAGLNEQVVPGRGRPATK